MKESLIRQINLIQVILTIIEESTITQDWGSNNYSFNHKLLIEDYIKPSGICNIIRELENNETFSDKDAYIIKSLLNEYKPNNCNKFNHWFTITDKVLIKSERIVFLKTILFDLKLQFLKSLNYTWTARVILGNNEQISIWYTSLASSLDDIKEIVSISSDYPKHTVNPELILI